MVELLHIFECYCIYIKIRYVYHPITPDHDLWNLLASTYVLYGIESMLLLTSTSSMHFHLFQAQLSLLIQAPQPSQHNKPELLWRIRTAISRVRAWVGGNPCSSVTDWCIEAGATVYSMVVNFLSKERSPASSYNYLYINRHHILEACRILPKR